jgi:hypothetical protein
MPANYLLRRLSALTGLIALLAMLTAQTLYARSLRIYDTVDFSSAISRTAHRVTFQQGALRREPVSFGTLIIPASGVKLTPGGRAQALLTIPRGEEKPLSLQLSFASGPAEWGKRQAYRVLVNGKEALRSTERDPGGGVVRSLFLEIPAARSPIRVEIIADPDSETSVTISHMRLYQSLLPTTAEERVRLAAASPPGLALLSSQGAGFSIHSDEMRKLFHQLPRSASIVGQTAVLYNFCVRSPEENAQEIRRLSALAEEMGVALRILFQFHWGGVPSGVSDGAGGTFTDLPYQQITYDPDDQVEDPGLPALMGDRYDVRFGLSVPNIWSNTPWLTFNHPRLNQFRRIRLTRSLRVWREERERLEAKGKGRLLPMELSTGEETIYWAKGVQDSSYTKLNNNKPRANLMADFNPFTVADALRDGVNLDPRNGLDNRERWWLHQNMARQQQRIIDWMADAIPPESIRVTNGKPEFARDLIRRNLFTEPYAMPHFPLRDVTSFHPQMEVGYVREGRSGAEYWSGETMLPWLLKQRERGRISLPNLECTGANDEQLVACLRAAYACGSRYFVLYNWHYRQNTAALLRAFTESIETPAGLEWLPAAASTDGSKQTSLFRREYAAPAGAFGINRIELFRQDSGATTASATLRLLDPIQNTGVSLPIMLAPAGSTVIYLPTLFHQVSDRRYLLTVETSAGVELARAADGQMAARITSDILAERSRSFSIQDWQDAEDILESLKGLHARTEQSLFSREALSQAISLLTARQPQEAYRAAIRAEQLSLPATFDLPAPGGRLVPYWVRVDCPGGPVRATLVTYSQQSAVIRLRSSAAQTVRLQWGESQTTATLSPDVWAEVTLVTPRRIKRRPVRRAPARPLSRPPAPSPARPPAPSPARPPAPPSQPPSGARPGP